MYKLSQRYRSPYKLPITNQFILRAINGLAITKGTGDQQISVTWTPDDVAGDSAYHVELYVNFGTGYVHFGGDPLASVGLASYSNLGPEYTVGTNLTVRIRRVHNTDISAWRYSNTLTVVKLDPLVGTTLTLSGTDIIVDWSTSGIISGDDIEIQSSLNGGAFDSNIHSPASDGTYTLSGIDNTPGNTYDIRIRRLRVIDVASDWYNYTQLVIPVSTSFTMDADTPTMDDSTHTMDEG